MLWMMSKPADLGNRMNKRKLSLILLAVVGVIILIIGIGAANIYSQTFPREARNSLSQGYYDENYDELSRYQKSIIDEALVRLGLQLSIEEKNAQFKQWLVKPLKWIGIGFGIFIILTAALVVSRVISNKIRPPSGSS